MEAFSALLALCVGNSPVTGEFPSQKPVTRSFDVYFDLRLNQRLSKQSWGWWFETPLRPLWRHCNVFGPIHIKAYQIGSQATLTRMRIYLYRSVMNADSLLPSRCQVIGFHKMELIMTAVAGPVLLRTGWRYEIKTPSA